MKGNITLILIIIFLFGASAQSAGQPGNPPGMSSRRDSVMINFHQSKWNLDPALGNNAAALDSVDRRLTKVFGDSVYRLQKVTVSGGASPEGSVSFNKFLSEQRAATLFGWFDRYGQLTDLDKTFIFHGRDWEGVLRLAEKDQSVPYREETLALLRSIAEEKRSNGGAEPARSLERMKRLRGGVPYRYLYRNIFPLVRASKVVIDYDRVLTPEAMERKAQVPLTVTDTIFVDRVVQYTDTLYFNSCPRKPFYMDIRTNMIYDVLALPNIGIEFYLGKNLTLGANWMYAWWKTDRTHWYWRAYGGELFGRWWFGKKANEKPLTGHHLGVYGQLYTYDFEMGGEGEMGGKPGGDLWDQNLWSAGVEYGYSLPIGRRINIDFSIGVGYSTGLYHKYEPIRNCYVWKSTHRRHYFGPTKLEVALVWLIGRGNVNAKKGGKR